MEYVVIVEQGETSFGAYVPDLPGCVAVAESRDEAMELIREAIELHIGSLATTASRYRCLRLFELVPQSATTVEDRRPCLSGFLSPKMDRRGRGEGACPPSVRLERAVFHRLVRAIRVPTHHSTPVMAMTPPKTRAWLPAFAAWEPAQA
jgi:predicted RNase H-like HicB family nuclease